MGAGLIDFPLPIIPPLDNPLYTVVLFHEHVFSPKRQKCSIPVSVK